MKNKSLKSRASFKTLMSKVKPGDAGDGVIVKIESEFQDSNE